jgi:hypothetical protein
MKKLTTGQKDFHEFVEIPLKNFRSYNLGEILRKINPDISKISFDDIYVDLYHEDGKGDNALTVFVEKLPHLENSPSL